MRQALEVGTRAAAFAAALTPALAAQSVSNAGLAIWPTPIAGANEEVTAFLAQEANQGADLNNDGDILDGVLYVHRDSTATNHSTGILVFPGSSQQRIVIADRLLVCATREAYYGPGGTDLNGDGDATDRLPAVYDTLTGTTTFLRSTVSNSAFGKAWSPTAGQHVLFGADEFTFGADLNGDGDLFDEVLQRWDVGSASPQNLGLAVVAIAVGPQSALFTVSETAQRTDYNLDGDTLDEVVHSLDFATGTIANLGIDSPWIQNDGNLFAFVGDESASALGTDYNGDSDSGDRVLFAYIGTSGTLRNLGSPLEDTGSFTLTVRKHLIVWGASEAQAGTGVDWNLDGDALDLVVHTHNARSGVTRNSGLATNFSSSSLPKVYGDRVAFVVDEASQGAADRDGDGDAADAVITIFDARTAAITNVGLARSNALEALQLTREFVTFFVDEFAQGQQDLNGDGHISQFVAGSYRFATGATVLLPIAAAAHPQLPILGSRVVFLADEEQTGLDANGDGDAFDDVLTSWNLQNGVVTNHGVASGGMFVHTRRSLIFAVVESLQGSGDLNGDLDVVDNVAHVLRF